MKFATRKKIYALVVEARQCVDHAEIDKDGAAAWLAQARAALRKIDAILDAEEVTK